MPYIQLDGEQYPLLAGDNVVGPAPEARIRLSGGDGTAASALLQVGADGSAVVRRAGAQPVKVNGVQLGAEPAPLIHGDKIEIGGRELFFGDDRKAGNTQYVPSVKLPEGAGLRPAPHGKPTAATGGRLVSLVDGREYQIPAGGLVIGRDPSCDVVVASTEVSRRHATIAAGTDGYVLTDTSTNGVLVNGEPVAKPARLGRGDVVRIGGEELRFYADSVPAAPELPPALATLEVVSSGLLKGQSFAVRRALSHIGRGAHNDIVIADESVSDSHAKLQRREGGWFVVDMDSTNGTYVGGRRIAGEQQLVGAPDLRFGGVKFIFRASDDGGAGGPGQTRAIASLKPDPRQRTDGRPVEAPPSKTPQRVRSIAPAPAPSPAGPSRGSSVVLWIVLLGVFGVGVLLLLASR